MSACSSATYLGDKRKKEAERNREKDRLGTMAEVRWLLTPSAAHRAAALRALQGGAAAGTGGSSQRATQPSLKREQAAQAA